MPSDVIHRYAGTHVARCGVREGAATWTTDKATCSDCIRAIHCKTCGQYGGHWSGCPGGRP